MHVYGDSILRGLQDNLELETEVFCVPGCTIKALRSYIRRNIVATDDIEVVFIHVGTNNLSSSVWDWDRSAYTDLYITVREKYPTSKIIFSAILPRWDFQLLYEASVYYNLKLHSLTTSFSNCAFVDLSSSYSLYSDLFLFDGLHLNFFGKKIFAEEVKSAIIKCTCISVRRSSNKYVPPELKKLWSPRRIKKKKINMPLSTPPTSLSSASSTASTASASSTSTSTSASSTASTSSASSTASTSSAPSTASTSS